MKQKGCSQRKIRSPEHCLELKRWQGPPHINKVNSMKLCSLWKSVCLSSFIFNHENKESLFVQFAQPMTIFLLRLKKLKRAPLTGNLTIKYLVKMSAPMDLGAAITWHLDPSYDNKQRAVSLRMCRHPLLHLSNNCVFFPHPSSFRVTQG